MQYRLRTQMILMAFGPPVLAWDWQKVEEHHRCQELRRIGLELKDYSEDTLRRVRQSPVVWAKPTNP